MSTRPSTASNSPDRFTLRGWKTTSPSERMTTRSISAILQSSGRIGIDEPAEAAVVRRHYLRRQRVRTHGTVEDAVEHRRLIGASHEENDLRGGVQHDGRERDAPHPDLGDGFGHHPALRLARRV